MRDWLNERIQQALDYRETAPFNILVRAVSEEIFRITEWLTLAAAVGVVGAKLELPAVTAIRYFLVSVIAAYLGARTASWIAALHRGEQQGLTRVLVIGSPFAVAAAYLMDILIKGLIKAAL